MQAWFLKADNEAWEKVIQTVTGPHAHMELMFSDGQFFSSTTELGPRFTTFAGLFSQNMDDWDVIDIPATAQDEIIVRALAEMIIHGLSGEKPVYGKETIALDFLPIPITRQSPNEWICSESCVYVLQSIGLYMGYIAQQLAPHPAYVILQKELPVWQQLRFQETG